MQQLLSILSGDVVWHMIFLMDMTLSFVGITELHMYLKVKIDGTDSKT